MNSQTASLKSLPATNETEKMLVSAYAEKQRFRYETDLVKFKNQLLNRGMRIVEKEYAAWYEKLQNMGAGSIVYGRGHTPTRFKWNYNLKKYAQSTAPQKSTEKRAPKDLTKHVTMNIHLTLHPDDVRALVELVRTMR